jgi:hypothetical protein
MKLAKNSRSRLRAREVTTSLRCEEVAQTLKTAKVTIRDFSRYERPWRECLTNAALDVRDRHSEVHVNAKRGCFSDGDIGLATQLLMHFEGDHSWAALCRIVLQTLTFTSGA